MILLFKKILASRNKRKDRRPYTPVAKSSSSSGYNVSNMNSPTYWDTSSSSNDWSSSSSSCNDSSSSSSSSSDSSSSSWCD